MQVGNLCSFLFLCLYFGDGELEELCAPESQYKEATMAEQQDVQRYTPFMRHSWARAAYQKILEDQQNREADHSHWYSIKIERLPERYHDKFLQCEEDRDTKIFLESSYDKSEAIFTQVYHQVAKSFLSWFISSTSINGLLQRGSMFVFSKNQFQNLLQVSSDWKAESLLDLGAGDGKVTEIMAEHFNKVYATEMSTPMQWRLQEKGYRILGIDEWASQEYDVISCLNLLDRCDKPVKLLQDMKKSLKPSTGRLIVAVVLPFKPYVEFNKDHKPEQYIHIEGRTFEPQVAHFIEDVFEPAGYTVERFTKLPYLCEGDLEHSFYVLHDAVFVLKIS